MIPIDNVIVLADDYDYDSYDNDYEMDNHYDDDDDDDVEKMMAKNYQCYIHLF